MSLPTASALDRVLHCPASYVLPQVRQQSDAADYGTGVHAFIVRAREIGRDEALTEIPADASHRDLCAQLPLDELPTGGRMELAYAWNYVTGEARLLGEGQNRSYADVTPEEYPGTGDLMGGKDGRGIAIDWKSGRYVGSPKTAPQLLLPALVLMNIDDSIDEVEVSFFYLRDDGTFYKDAATVDRFDLAAFAARLRALPAEIEKARAIVESGRQPDVSNGPWCRYCPAAAACPANVALVRSVMLEAPAIVDRLAQLEPAKQGEWYEKIGTSIDLLEQMKAGLKEVARINPIPLPDGRILREVEWKIPTKVDADVAEEVLTELHGEKVAHAAVTVEKSTTLTAIEGALRTVAQPGKLAGLKKQAIEKVRQRGGLKEGTSPQVRAVKNGKGE